MFLGGPMVQASGGLGSQGVRPLPGLHLASVQSVGGAGPREFP